MASCIRNLARKKYVDPKTVIDTRLARVLTVLDLTSLGVGSTLGAGVYVVACEIARDVAGPATVLSFFIAGFASVLSGLCYAEFGARVPKAGSAYIYSYVTIGELVAFIIGWNLILEYMIGAAAIARAWSAYFDSCAFGDKLRAWVIQNIGSINVKGLGNYPDFLAFVVIMVITLTQILGVKKSTRFIFVITFINIFVILFIIVVGITLARPEYWSDFMPYGTTGVLAGSATAFFAFVGFDVIATTGEEAINPSKTIPISIVLSLVICFLAYFGVSASVTLIWPYDKLDYGAALPKAFLHRGANYAQYVIAVGALCGMTAAINGGLFPLPRLLYAMSSDGLIFWFFSYVSKKTEVPLVGTLFSGFLSGVLAMLFELQELVEMMSIGTLQAYTIVSTSVLVLRYQPGSVGLVRETEQSQSTGIASGPTEKSGKTAKYTIGFLFFYFFAMSLFLIHGLLPMFEGEVWAILLCVMMVVVLIVCVIVISLQPQSLTPLPFKVPLIPALPLVSMFINIYLMMELNTITWIRFGIWMVIGMSIYLFYGLRHSVEGKRAKESGDDYIPLEQVESTEDPAEKGEDGESK